MVRYLKILLILHRFWLIHWPIDFCFQPHVFQLSTTYQQVILIMQYQLVDNFKFLFEINFPRNTVYHITIYCQLQSPLEFSMWYCEICKKICSVFNSITQSYCFNWSNIAWHQHKELFLSYQYHVAVWILQKHLIVLHVI